MSKKEFNKEAKSNLAKLLATENITVEHRKVQTAFFDLGKRLLVVIFSGIDERTSGLIT